MTAGETPRSISLQRRTLRRVTPIAVLAIAVLWAAVALIARHERVDSWRQTFADRLEGQAALVDTTFRTTQASARGVARNSTTIAALIGQDVERVVRPFLETFAIGEQIDHSVGVFDFVGELIIASRPCDALDALSGGDGRLVEALLGRELVDLVGDRVLLLIPIKLAGRPEGVLAVGFETDVILGGVFGAAGGGPYDGTLIRAPLGQSAPSLDMRVEADRLVGVLTRPLAGAEHIAVVIRGEMAIPSWSEDSVQRFLALVFLTLLALTAWALHLATGWVIAPVRALVGRIERHGIELGPDHPGDPEEIRLLAHRFRAAAAEIEEALRQEKAFSAQQRQFVSTVSHEFRTPLSIIDGLVGGLQRRRHKMSDEKIEQTLGKVRAAVVRLVELMERTLTSSKLQAGVVQADRTDADIRAVIQQAIADRRALAPHVLFSEDLAALPARMRIDERLIQSAIDNLLSNAIKYSGAAAEVAIAVQRVDDRVEIAIRDNGVGIPPAELGRVGRRYFRASTAADLPGAGIGVSIVRMIARLHGGALRVDSTLGEGSVFTLVLPLDADAAADASCESAQGLVSVD